MGRCRSFLCVMAVAVLSAGCASLWQSPRQGTSSSLVEYLFPDGEEPRVDQGIPHLVLPVRVGLAFVPSKGWDYDSVLSEARKRELLEEAKKAFAGRDFISSIEVIPETYLRGGKGFQAIDQVARLYDLDVMALVSYDQVAITEDTKASIFYWTIVGAYLVSGTQHDVQTFVDTAVFDIKTRKLLFRDPGTNTLAETSTLVNSPEDLRKQRDASFAKAMTDMTKNLDAELSVFRERVKTEGVATVASRDGGSGGALDWGVAALALLLLVRRRFASS
ncbi:MAG: rhombotarget lipoprotein [Gammaproteobacteria bacterium]|nr:rhombotarget lipoprotein [Gammaproteobacteria bacterium]